MSEINLFEQATKQKLRFQSPRGLLTVEDLWDLKLTTGQANLNDIGITIQRALKDTAEESLVPSAKTADSKETTRLKLQLDIVKHIIAIKVDEQDQREKAAARAEQRREILEALEDAQRGALKSKTPEELKAMLDALG